MTIETDLVMALSLTFGGRVYPDTNDDPAGLTLPFCTFQQVGGVPLNYMDGVPTARNARMQFNVWAKTRNEANTLMRAIDVIVRSAPFHGTSLGDLIATYEETTKTRGAMQDFSLWWQAS
jgi:hypothetical protein